MIHQICLIAGPSAGFSCQWELLPDYPELTLTVDYSNLLPDESITLYLAPSNVIQLRRPEKADKGGIFQTTVWVERSIFVEFQTTRNSTSDGRLELVHELLCLPLLIVLLF
jgi:hypothetical protein